MVVPSLRFFCEMRAEHFVDAVTWKSGALGDMSAHSARTQADQSPIPVEDVTTDSMRRSVSPSVVCLRMVDGRTRASPFSYDYDYEKRFVARPVARDVTPEYVCMRMKTGSSCIPAQNLCVCQG
jgi:hypothetical protein